MGGATGGVAGTISIAHVIDLILGKNGNQTFQSGNTGHAGCCIQSVYFIGCFRNDLTVVILCVHVKLCGIFQEVFRTDVT